MKLFAPRVRRLVLRLLLVVALAVAVFVLFLRPASTEALEFGRGSVRVEALGTGSVESRRTVDLAFEVTGRVTAILVDQGDSVTAGQELARLDDGTFRAEASAARESVRLAESTLARLEAEIQRSEAVLIGAEHALDRIRPLVEGGAASEEALDAATERYAVAVAELARSRAARIEGLVGVGAAQSALERSEAELARTVVHSPFDGLVLLRRREVGDVAVPGAAVLRLAATDTIWARVWVDETYLGQLAPGLTARVALRSAPERELPGRVARIGREVDRETRELLVDVEFETSHELLVLGQRVDLWIQLDERRDVLRIPSRAVVRRAGREGAFVFEGGRARFRELQLGARGRDFVEVASGLAEGETLLEPRAGKRALSAGQRVRVASSEEAGGAR